MARGERRETADAGLVAPIAAAPGVPCKLVVVSGPDSGLEVALDGSIEVGSAEDNDVVLSDEHVSRHHMSLSLVAGRVVLTDRESRNGTYLGGVRVRDAEVPLGAVIQLGPKTTLAVQPRWHMREVTPSSQRSFGELIGESVGMRELFAILQRVAPADVTVLIEGETGTGKEIVARTVHRASRRAAGPYLVFDCSAVPRELAESELFGHKRGAFSGAVADRVGAFQRAHGGTICLDEIGELPLELQPKLLRVLETGDVRPVGSDVTSHVDVRVVAATNRDLHAEAMRGTFRQDLLYRLDVVRVRVPPLRHRPEDVSLLTGHFLRDKIDTSEPITGENLRRLLGYAWPGNVRELRNALARALALATRPGAPPPRFSELVLNLGPANAEPLSFGMAYPGVVSPLPYKEAKEQLVGSFEREYVAALMERAGGSVTRAAALSGLSRKHLYELLRRSGERMPSDLPPESSE